MSRFEGPQGIVTNGLVLNLDAGDPDSYTRSQPPYVEVLVVAGGGGGGQDGAGGGGAGGLIYNSAYQLTNASAITVTVGGGGAGTLANPGQASDGSNSVFGSLTAVGGGGGGSKTTNGRSGGSGGGAGHNAAGASSNIGGDGTAGQGFRGGNNIEQSGGGGGGAGQPGFYGTNPVPGNGGNGNIFAISGTPTYYAGGGGGGGYASPVTSSGGLGGGGNGGGYVNAGAPSAEGKNGTANTGGGGGSNGNASNSTVTGTGGSGIVIIRYPGLPAATGGTITYLNGYTIHTFTSSGTFTPYLWNDVSGNSNNGTLTNGPTFNSNQVGGYLNFDGSDDYVSVPYNSVLNTPSGATYELWIYRSNGGTFLARGTSDAGATPDNPRFYIYPSGGNEGQIYYDWSTVGSDKNGYSTINLSANTWYNIIVTAVPGGQLYLYINGTDRSGTWNGGALPNPLNNTSDPIIVGGSSWAGVFSGRIAVTRLYNRILSQAEITQNYNAQKNRFGL
jgi:hypothetical protein